MKSFTIENETNNITIHASAKEAEAVSDAEHFGTEAALLKLAANWPAARLVEIWNSLPGAVPVQKFKDRGTAARRIWKAIQSLEVPPKAAPTAASNPPVAPTDASPNTNERRAKRTHAATKNGTRKDTRTEAILGLLKQLGGSTLRAIMEATSWQAHSVRGFISGTLGKKMGLTVVSENDKNGERAYSIHA